MADLVVKEDPGTGEDYLDLASALLDAGLTSGDTISIDGLWDGDDDSDASVQDDGITIKAINESIHPGYINTAAKHYRLRVSNGQHALTISGNFTCTVENIVVIQAGTGTSDEGIRAVPDTGKTITIRDCIVRCENNSSSQDCIYTGFNTAIGTVVVEQCIIYGANRGGITSQQRANSATIHINSCTVWDCGRGGGTNDGGIIQTESTATSAVVFRGHNNLVVGNTTGSAADINFNGPNPDRNFDYTIVSDGSITVEDSGSTGSLENRTATDNASPGAGDWVVFEDITTAPYDLRLKTSAENDAEEMHSVQTAQSLTIPTNDIVGTSRNSSGTPQQGTDFDCGAFELLVSSGQTVVVGLSTETDSVPAPTIIKTRSVSPANETDTVPAPTLIKTADVGVSSETDVGLAATHSKTIQVSVATEIDSVPSPTILKTALVGLSTETDSVPAAVFIKTLVAGFSTETDSVPSPTILKTKIVGLATETDAALAATIPGAIVVNVGVANETDSVLAPTLIKTFNATLATESDVALSVSVTKTRTTGLATETDSAPTSTHSKTVQVGLANESDVTFPASIPGAVLAGLATESDAALGVSVTKTIQVGIATEINTALSGSVTKTKQVGLTNESNSVPAPIIGKIYTAGLSTETDAALGVSTGVTTIPVGLTTEADLALSANVTKVVRVGLAEEVNLVIPLGEYELITGTVSITRQVTGTTQITTKITGTIKR